MDYMFPSKGYFDNWIVLFESVPSLPRLPPSARDPSAKWVSRPCEPGAQAARDYRGTEGASRDAQDHSSETLGRGR